MKLTVATFQYQPRISLIMPVYNTPEIFLREAIQSVLEQVYPHWELCIADDASTHSYIKPILQEYQAKDDRIKVKFRTENGHISATSNSALELATGEFIGLLDHDDILAPNALYEVVSLLNQHPEADMIYSDEDKLDENNQLTSPFFKPDWCPDSFFSRMYTCHFGVYRRELINKIGGFRIGYEGSQDYDLVLRITEKTDKIFHIPKILYHWREHSNSAASGTTAKPYAYQAAKKALLTALQRRGEPGKVELNPAFLGCSIIRYQITNYKKVSIIIPTRDLGEILNQCLTSIFTKTVYPNYEVILIDNGSRERQTADIIKQWQVQQPQRFKSFRLDIPFNFSTLNNYGVQQATGEYLLFLNNDIEVIEQGWMNAMVEQVQRPSIGAVGALLQYPDGRIQHAGVILGMGHVAAHSHQFIAANKLGYCGQLISINNYSAVTAACLMCRRSVFEEVRGFDEKLAVSYNDVDLCLKMKQQGYHHVCLPHVKLYHHESKSRGYDNTPEKLERYMAEVQEMRQRWNAEIEQDSCYNPHLTLAQFDYRLRRFATVEIINTSIINSDSEMFLDMEIEAPQTGIISGISELKLKGWVIAKHSSVVAVQLIGSLGQVIKEFPGNYPRLDIAKRFPNSLNAQNCGFQETVEVNQIYGDSELLLQAVFRDGQYLLFGKIKLTYHC
ncbi:MAG: glycosyltransferase family 2 protein [Microcoleaceae cyanobacterium]